MDADDRRLLEAVQTKVPLERRPFAALGAALGLQEAEVLHRLSALKAEGVIRQIGAIFDTVRLGYRSCLVAARVPGERVEAAAQAINAHPGVSHHYERASGWNLWFTLAVPPDSFLGLEGTATHLGRLAGADEVRLLPALRVFKIGVRLDMDADAPADRKEMTTVVGPHPPTDTPVLDADDRRAVRLLQADLALVREPFDADLLSRAQALLERGVMRRFAAVLYHRRAGYSANVLGVWAVPAEQVETVGSQIAAFRAVSHCYQRPIYPDWPYSVFSMIHGRSREECHAVLAAISAETGIADYGALWSLREFKKVRLRYFTPDHAEWERRIMAEAYAGVNAR